MSRKLALWGVGLSLAVAGGSVAAQSLDQTFTTDRLIVKWRAAGLAHSKPGEAVRAKTRVLAKLGRPLATIDTSTGDTAVVELGGHVLPAEARQLAELLEHDALVEYAEPDRRVFPAALPNDPDFPKQWHLQPPSSVPGAIDAVSAWAVTRGSSNVVVAVVDTGIVAHADLAANLLPGYDMISSATIAGDSNRRDSDPTDTGDWTAANECGDGGRAQTSSWHGTHVAGIIGGVSDNHSGGAGVAPSAKVLPVRAMGKCGGYVSDVADAIRWAAGLKVSGAPLNPNPAKIINLSLGSPGDCSRTEQRAIDEVIAAGALVVAAAGNSGQDVAGSAPANCANVVVVAAVGKRAAMASYSNFGSRVTIAAPGGDSSGGILSTYNTGDRNAVADSYDWLQGTSMATPQVSAVAALMFAANGKLSPAQVKEFITASARPFPTGTGRDCTTATCGAGLLDAAGAVQLASFNTVPVVTVAAEQRVNPGVKVDLSGSATDADGSVVFYLWRQTEGATVTLTNGDQAQARYLSPSAGVQRFELVATDDNGGQGVAKTTITINQSPRANAGSLQRVVPGSTVTLTAAASSDDSKIASYLWRQMAGPLVILQNSASVTPSFVAPTTSSRLSFELTVTDEGGLNANTQVLVIADAPPVAAAGADSVIAAGSAINLNGSASRDPEGQILKFQWSQTKGAPVRLDGASKSEVAFVAGPEAEELEFQLTVTDVEGNIASDRVGVTVRGAPGLKVPASISTSEGAVLEFDVIVVTTLGRGATMAVDGFPEGAVYDASTGRFAWSAPKLGRYELIFTARDLVDPVLATQRLTTIDVLPAQRAAQTVVGGGATPTPAAGTVSAENDSPKCFIATAAFGTGMASEVRYLRALRDQYLLTNTPGRWFVNFYYSVSPPIADFLRRHDTLRAGMRAVLEPLVEFAKWIVSDESYDAQTSDKA